MRVYVAYARSDSELARELKSTLSAHGIELLDHDTSMRNLAQRAEEVVGRADVIIAFLTQNSVGSRWVTQVCKRAHASSEKKLLVLSYRLEQRLGPWETLTYRPEMAEEVAELVTAWSASPVAPDGFERPRIANRAVERRVYALDFPALPGQESRLTTSYGLGRRIVRRNVAATLFSQSQIREGRASLIQVWVYEEGDESTVKQLAKEADRKTKIKGRRSLGLAVEFGDEVRVALECAELEIVEPVQMFEWRGQPVGAQFECRLRPGIDAASDVLVTARVFVGDCPVLRTSLILRAARVHGNRGRQVALARYQSAFLSYSSTDRSIVVEHAQLLRSLGMQVFLDVLSLRAGDEWERGVQEMIEQADLFLLYWSMAAAQSREVEKEIRCALRCQGRPNSSNRPDIVPYVLGPPIPAPPAGLEHLHFNDALRALREGY